MTSDARPWGSRLWQRIFSFTLLLVLMSQATPFFLIYLEMDSREDRRRSMTAFIHNIILVNLDGRAEADAKMYLDYFNGLGPQLWFERPDGTVLSGEPVAGLAFEDRKNMRPVATEEPEIVIYEAEGLSWETGPSEPLGLLVASMEFEEGPSVLCYTYWNGSFPHMEDYFYQGVVALVLAGGLLSFWMARRVAQPLRRLQSEVLAIGENNLDASITEQGIDEVRDVARSVNQLTGTLSCHVSGMRELLANVSHELRSPLTRIDFAVTFLEEGISEAEQALGPPRPDRAMDGRSKGGYAHSGKPEIRVGYPKLRLARKHLEYLKEEVAVMETLIGTSLLSSKLDLRQQPLEPVPVNISELCRDMAAGQASLIEKRGLSLVRSIEEGLYVNADALLLRQVVGNLLDNACKYVEAGKQFCLRLQSCSGEQLDAYEEGADSIPRVCLFVENPCAGLGREELERLFEPFYRAGRATGNGAGLGLSLVRKIVALHRGSVAATLVGETEDPKLRITVCLPQLCSGVFNSGQGIFT